jgi:dipeptidyl-peptidase 4
MDYVDSWPSASKKSFCPAGVHDILHWLATACIVIVGPHLSTFQQSHSSTWRSSMTRIFLRNALAAILLATIVPVATAQSVRPNWSADGSRFWFRSTDSNKAGTFFIVDAAARSRAPAFDNQKLAAALSEALKENVSAADLLVETMEFTESLEHLLLMSRGKWWRLNLNSYEIETVERPETASSANRLFLPAHPSRDGGESTNVVIENRLDQPLEFIWIATDGSVRRYGIVQPGETREQHTYVHHVWLLKSDNGRSLACFEAQAGDHLVIDDDAIANIRRESGRLGERRRGGGRGPGPNSRPESPSRKWTAFVRDHNLWIRDGDQELQLSSDGTEANSYGPREGGSPDVRWSPDSNFIVAFQTKVVPERSVYLIDSSPADQLQPKLESYLYRKPGDELPTPTLHLFSLPDSTEIPVSRELFHNPWSLRFSGWSESGDRFYLHYNARGHQTIRVLEVAVADGAVRTIIEETSQTFIQYSDAGKSVFEDLSSDEILWASERSGWNHLYRYSRSTAQVLNAVTAGEWNVKRIEKIDRDAKQIWFYAVGVHAGQDPYHEHLCRVNFDGGGFRTLTDGDGTHSIRFEQDGKYFVDTYSRVDMAPVTELRDSSTGELVGELQRDNTSEKFPDGRRLTERFVAKGRDGQTDIWGIIHWPRGFDPGKKYPVVENIYAGPHSHHVPKSFRTRYEHQHRIADAGMIVVQIDGMGTAWRSKAFHDVCYKNLRDAGFPDRIAWMKAAAEKYPQMDLTRVGIYGGSAGGQNAMAALLWHNDFYKVAVADCGCHDNRMDKIWWNEQWMGWPVDDSYARNSNMENAHLLKGDLMLLVGELDRNVDPASTTQVVRQLIKHNKDFEFVLVAGAGHSSAETPWGSQKRLQFLKEHLGAN